MTKNRKELFTEVVPAGSRTYYFDVKESLTGMKYLVISESRGTESGFEHDRVMVFEENLDAFCAGLEEAVSFLNSEEQSKSYSVEEIRESHPRAYEPWLPDEEQALRTKYQSGLSINQLADLFERKPGAIRSRLRKLGIKNKTKLPDHDSDHQDYPRTGESWTPAEDKALRIKFAQGIGLEGIANDLQRHSDVIEARLNELDLLK